MPRRLPDPKELAGIVASQSRRRVTKELAIAQRGRCYWCGRVFDRHLRPTFDHIVCASAGGPDTKENGVASCEACNVDRGNKPFLVYARQRGLVE